MSRAGWMLALLAAVGCGGSNPKAEDFVPPEHAARAALDASLKAWLDHGPEAKAAGTPTPVETADGLRTKNRILAKYEILGPVPGDAPRCFAVRLVLGNPAQELKERYVVLGLDPLWVWRYDDYLMLTHWDHAMVEKDKKAAPTKR